MTDDESDYDVGDIVVDKEAENPDEAVVVRKTDLDIAEWEVESGTTVAATNPEYDEDEDTVLVAFTHYLDEYWPEWEDVDDRDLYHEMMDNSLKWYAFPESRLVPVEEGDME
jgi:hypothetical protein